MTAFVVLLLAYTLSQFFRAFLAIVAGNLTADLGLDARQLGDLSAIWFISFALTQFPVGIALDRFGARITTFGFMLAAVAGSALFATVTDFKSALVAMALIGIGCAPVLMRSLYVFGRAYPPERFAMLTSLIIGLGSAGNLLGAAPLAWAVAAIGWRASMAAISGVTAVSCLLVLVLLREPPRPPRSLSPADHGRLADLLRLRPLWLIAPLALVGYAFVIALRSLWIAPFLQTVHGFDAVARGEAALLMAAAMSAGALAYGPIDRFVGSAKITVLAGSIVTAAMLAALGVWGDRSAVASVALFAGIGAFGMSYGILMAHSRLFFPPQLLGRGVTLMNFVFIGGAGIVQWVSGRFVQATQNAGWGPAETYAVLHTGFAMVLAAATVLYFFAPQRPDPTREP